MTSKFALIIVNTEYQDASFAKLTAPGKDAEEFAHILRDAEVAAFEDVQILLNEGEGKTRRSIARFFAERKPADLLLLYFSGHGVRNEQGQLFLAVNDTEINILEATGIPAEFITRAMNNSRSQRQLLILDCCNSGAFAHGTKSASGVGKSMGIATAFEGDGYGRVVLTATDATQFAWEGDKVIGDTQKSVFTHFLIEGLKGEADRDSDGRIHVDELYDYAYEQVVRRTPKQTPGKWSYKQQGDMILRENLKPRDVKPAPLPPDLLDLLSHPNSGVRKVGVQDLISLLEGKHLGLTRAAEEKLREIAANDDSFTLRKTASDTLIAHGIMLEQSVDVPKENLSQAKPAPVEAPKEERKEEKLALSKVEGKIEKPAQISSQPIQQGNVRERTPRSLPDWKSIAPKLTPRLIGGIAGGLLVISLLIWGGSKLFLNLLTATAEPTSTTQDAVMFPNQASSTLTFPTNMMFTPEPSKNDTPFPTLTSISSTQTSVPPTPTRGIGSTMISDKDGMTLLYVPAGEFTMGADYWWERGNERPMHRVYLDVYWIDQTEVTVGSYSLCVADGVCQKPTTTSSYSNPNYYNNVEFQNYPVIHVTWNMAKTYCEWAGRRLPTEAEWEKAARGEDAHKYPWGNAEPTSDLTNMDLGVGDVTDVSKYPKGASPYGILDMAGNAWEWVADWYNEDYYSISPQGNPQGPDSGTYRVVKGGVRMSYKYYFDSSVRNKLVPEDSHRNIGFRCAMNATR